MTPRFQALMAVAWQCGIARWDLLAATIPEPVLNGWVEWISANGLHPAQRDQFVANIGAALISGKGIEVKPDDLMRIRLDKPWTDTEEV